MSDKMDKSPGPPPVSDLDWSPAECRRFGVAAVELWASLLERLSELPVSRRSTPDEVGKAVAFDIPEEGLTFDALQDHLHRFVHHSCHTGHPAFLAYIMGSGTPAGVVADIIAGAVNQNVGGWRLSPAASEIEITLMRWLARRLGLPHGAAGLFVSGGAIGNLIALKTARDRALGVQARSRGLGSTKPRIYASSVSHVTIDRAADLMGMGHSAVRKIDVDDDFRMRPDALREAIISDLEDGYTPIAVVATCGTTSVGARDPMPRIAAICRDFGLWFHVDAAYGGAVALSDALRPLLAGIEEADSVTLDPHKWLYAKQSAGCVLFRTMAEPCVAFTVDDDYVYEDKEGMGSGLDFSDFGIQWSRGFDAFKVWFSLLASGRQAYARRIEHDMELALYFADLVKAHDDFELALPPNFSICCFRYAPKHLETGHDREDILNDLNRRLLAEVQLDGRVYPSNAILNGQFYLRICIANHRTEAPYLRQTLAVIEELGRKLPGSAPPKLTHPNSHP